MKTKEEIYRECWNNWVSSLWGKEWATDKGFEEVTPSIQHVYEAMELYAKQKLNIAGIVRPALDSSDGDEPLPESGAQNGRDGQCKHREVVFHKGYICKECNEALEC